MIVSIATLRRIIREAVGDEYFGPLIAHIRENPDDAIDMDWLQDNGFALLGQGAYRFVYSLPSDSMFVLKVAKDIYKNPRSGERDIVSKKAAYGASDNLTEVQNFNKFPRVFPKAYVYAPIEEIGGKQGVLWLVVEKVDVVGKESANIVNAIKTYMPTVYKFLLEQDLDFSEGSIVEQIKQKWYDVIFSMDAHKMGVLKYPTNILKTVFKREFGEKFTPKDFEYLITNDPKFREIAMAAENIGMAYRELRGDNLGITKSGNLVLIDASALDEPW